MRGALFNMLGDLSGLTVLDAFAGSGALAFEAVSRGAKSVLAIDSDKSAQQAIERNIKQLGLANQVKLVKAAAGSWLITMPDAQMFDIVLCDPPYDDLQLNLVARLKNTVRPDGGLLVLSWPGGQDLLQIEELDLIESRNYGDSSLGFYRR